MTRLRWAMDRGYVLGALALLVYGWLASPLMVGNDNGEFATLGVTGGIAHPSGYPAYVLWLRLWSWLPGSTPAHTAALATAVLGAMSVVVLHAACRAWGARPLAATLAVAVLAVSPLMLRVTTEAEAFAFNNLIAATVAWLAADKSPLRGVRRAAALGLVAGLGLSNHLTCALVAPIGLLGVARAIRESRAVVAVPAAIGCVCVGLTPYLYMFIAPDNVMSWMHPATLHDLVGIVLRDQYGGAGGFSGANREVELGAQLAELALTVARTWLWLLAPAGVIALVARIARPAGESRIAWSVLAASIAISGPILASRFDVEPRGLGLYVVHRFHILPIVLLAIPIAAALDGCLAWFAARRGREASPSGLGASLAHGLLIVLAIAALPEVARFHSPALDNEVRGILRALPRDSIVLVTTDELDVGFHYAQLALGERPDVLAFRTNPLGASWYRDRIPLPLTGSMTKPQIAEVALASGRPLFVHRGEREIITSFPASAFGPLVRIYPRGTTPPPLDEVIQQNRALFETIDLDYARPGPDDEFATAIHMRYAQVWTRIADALAHAGRQDEAARARELAAQLAPTR